MKNSCRFSEPPCCSACCPPMLRMLTRVTTGTRRPAHAPKTSSRPPRSRRRSLPMVDPMPQYWITIDLRPTAFSFNPNFMNHEMPTPIIPKGFGVEDHRARPHRARQRVQREADQGFAPLSARRICRSLSRVKLTSCLTTTGQRHARCSAPVTPLALPRKSLAAADHDRIQDRGLIRSGPPPSWPPPPDRDRLSRERRTGSGSR